MITNVVLSIRGRQSYMGQEPDIIEFMTEGFLSFSNGVWELSYEESALTGMEGVTTCFRIEPNKVTLKRTGLLNSEMVFQEGLSHDSLYKMEFGALLITVCATDIRAELHDLSGIIDLAYNIEIEKSAAGTIDYHIEIKPNK